MNDAPSAALPATPYRDRKRHAWLLSILAPTFVGSGPLLVHLSGQPGWAWAPVFFLYGLVPLLDLLLGEDRSNPPESAVPALEADRYYRGVTYATVPVLWIAFIGSIWYLTTQPLPLHAQIAVALSAGLIGGFGINLGHELGHKTTKLERWLAKIVLAPTGYGHFFIEHNHGHHRDVATPADPASSRMGETIYTFLLREMPGALQRAWAIEVERLRKRGLPVVSLHNEILQPALITLALWALLVAWLGWVALPFILAVVVLGQLPAELGQLHRALRPAARQAAQRPLRALPAAPFVEQQPHLLELDAVPPAAPFRPPCAPDAPLPVAAPLRQPADAAQRLHGRVPGGLPAAAVVPADGPAAGAGGRW